MKFNAVNCSLGFSYSLSRGDREFSRGSKQAKLDGRSNSLCCAAIFITKTDLKFMVNALMFFGACVFRCAAFRHETWNRSKWRATIKIQQKKNNTREGAKNIFYGSEKEIINQYHKNTEILHNMNWNNLSNEIWMKNSWLRAVHIRTLTVEWSSSIWESETEDIKRGMQQTHWNWK